MEKPYRIGALVKARNCEFVYRLPDAIPEGATIKVIGFDRGTATVLYEGKQFEISGSCIDNGMLYEIRGSVLAA